MKKLITVACVAVAFAMMAFTAEEKFKTLDLGETMPIMEHPMLSTSGDKMTLKDVKQERGTVVIFSCNTCPFVVAWEDRYNDISAIASRIGVGVVLINSNEAKRDGADSFEAMKEHAAEQNYQASYLVDESSVVANAFGAKTTPHVFMFDHNDKLVYEGAIDDNYEDKGAITAAYLQDAMMQMYKGDDITTPQTDAKGCSIKRLK